MGKTIVRLTIPFTFAAEGKYQVSIGGKIANIEITYVLNDDALNKIMEIEAMGERQLMPDDPEGLPGNVRYNRPICRIQAVLCFLVPP